MEKKFTGRKALLLGIASIAVLFGIMTIKSGGQVLFGNESYRVAAGNYVPFVLWFNFLTGFIYLVAGVGIALRKPWSTWLSLSIAAATLLVFSAFGVHIFTGGTYEAQTVAAMTLRSIVWVVISVFLIQNIKKGANNVA